MPAPIIPAVVEEHFDTLSHLWDVRDPAVAAPHYRLLHLKRVDDRLEANAQGVAIALGKSWAPPPADKLGGFLGDVFALALGHLKTGGFAQWQELAARAGDAAGLRPLTASLGWVAPRSIGPLVRALATAADARHRALWLSAYALHRVDPGAALTAALSDAEPLVRARALRTAGELGRRDLAEACADAAQDGDPACQFWSAWSATRLGDALVPARLLGFVGEKGVNGDRALKLGLRAAPGPEGKAFVRQARDTGVLSPRQVIAAAGIVGDPAALPWLLAQMADPKLARVAGEAFSLITGADLAYLDLETNKPEGFASGPTEEAKDEAVALDPDDNLPWPDAAKLEAWLKANRDRFASGTRHLLGRPIGKESCRQALAEGFQRQRLAAALELVLLEPGAALFEARAPTRTQQAALAALRP